MTARIYAIANRKGGSGKTTTTYSMGAGLAHKGYKVLLIDMDPQGDLTEWAGYDPYEKIQVYDVLAGYEKIEHTIINIEERLDLVPTDATLWNVMDDLSTRKESDLVRLKKALKNVSKDYDFILIDTPPSFGVLAYNSYIAAANGLIVTTDTSTFAIRAMEEVIDAVENIRELNKGAYPVGVLVTRYNGRSKSMRSLRETTIEFGEYWNIPVYDTAIRNTTAVIDALNNRESIYNVKNTMAANDYLKFIDEFLEKEGIGKAQ